MLERRDLLLAALTIESIQALNLKLCQLNHWPRPAHWTATFLIHVDGLNRQPMICLLPARLTSISCGDRWMAPIASASDARSGKADAWEFSEGLTPVSKVKEEPMISINSLGWKMGSTLLLISIILLAGPEPSAGQNPAGSGPALQPRQPRYLLQRQDVLSLTFPLSPELNQTVTIQPDGYISLQGAGSVYAHGLTVPELVVALKQAYSTTLRDPIISVDLQDFQKPFFTVQGQVGKPGQYDLRSDITVAEAISIAGGMTMTTAKTQVFLLHRSSEGWFAVREVNLKDILKGKHVNEDATIQPGDMIYVPEKFIAKFRKYVPYSAMAASYLAPSL